MTRCPRSAALLPALLVACGGGDAPRRAPAAAPPAAASPSGPASAPQWTLSAAGLGAVVVGDRVEDANRAVGGALGDPARLDPYCEFVPLAAPAETALVMVARGLVARVDVTTPGIRTAEGAGIGDTEDRLKTRYRGRVRVLSDRRFNDGHLLVVTPAGEAERRLIFETRNSMVTRVRAGRLPEVEWAPDRCD